MLTKKDVIDSLKTLPEEFEIDEAIERIILLEKIKIGQQQAAAGEVYTPSETREKLQKWLK